MGNDLGEWGATWGSWQWQPLVLVWAVWRAVWRAVDSAGTQRGGGRVPSRPLGGW